MKLKWVSKLPKTVAQFVAANGITIKSKHIDANALMGKDMDHWSSSLSRPKTRVIVNGALDCTGRKLKMTTKFSKGFGHNGAEPTAEEVLNCLALDATSIENSSTFTDWAQELGYDTDSRKAESIWRACRRGADSLKRFLGDDLYKELLWETESL